jgi:DNA-directed RNA polymerase sigma subunit (sigma70/sigma32)
MKVNTYRIEATSKMAQAAADKINSNLMSSGFSTCFDNEPEFKSAIEVKIKEELSACDNYIKANLKLVIIENDHERL